MTTTMTDRKTEAFKKIIIKSIAKEIGFEYQEEKEDSDFDAGEFGRSILSQQKAHFHRHPSAHIAKLCEDMNYDEANAIFIELFTAAWTKFVEENK